MKKAADFLKKAWRAIWKFVLRWWKVILAIAVGAVGVWAVVKIRARIGRVDRPSMFTTVPGADDKLAVRIDGEWKIVDLPENVKAKQVTAIEVTPAHELVVEVRHEKKNRRG